MLARLFNRITLFLFVQPLARLRCLYRGHWWRPHDLYSDECACCGAQRTIKPSRLHSKGEHP